MKSKSRRKRLILACSLLGLIALLVVIIGIFVIIPNMPNVFAGGCWDLSRYGGSTIRGTARGSSGSPAAGVKIHIQKSVGPCQESRYEDLKLTSNSNGEFQGGIPVHWRDPDMHITVSAGGYPDYAFDVSTASYQNTTIEVEIVLGERLQVNTNVIPITSATLAANATASIIAATREAK